VPQHDATLKRLAGYSHFQDNAASYVSAVTVVSTDHPRLPINNDDMTSPKRLLSCCQQNVMQKAILLLKNKHTLYAADS
jgi:hypothetical protein